MGSLCDFLFFVSCFQHGVYVSGLEIILRLEIWCVCCPCVKRCNFVSYIYLCKYRLQASRLYLLFIGVSSRTVELMNTMLNLRSH